METNPEVPKEPTKDESALLVNSSDKKRMTFWTDAAATLDRRITQLEREVTRSIWSIPALLALSISIAAFAVAVYCFHYVAKRKAF